MAVGDEVAGLASRLGRAVEVLGALGDTARGEQDKLQALRDRLAEGRFHLAVVGQFKRGKSTLVNALLGVPLIPTGVVPLTAVPTQLSYGPSLELTIRFADRHPERRIVPRDVAEGAERLADYVTETRNPNNIRGVAQVEVHLPADILQRGVVLIDTPGIGSTLSHNTATTLAFLPECDAALVVLSVDPPVTAAELEFLGQVRRQAASLVFVLNKIDYLTPNERGEAVEFVANVLHEQDGLADARVFPVSARAGLQALGEGSTDGWVASGMAELQQHLTEFLAREKTRALAAAVTRKADDILAAALSRVELTRRSLELPLGDLEQRLRLFEETLAEVESERLLAQDLLVGDRRRVHERLEEVADEVRGTARQALYRTVSGTAAATEDVGRLEEVVGERLKEVIPPLFDDLREKTVATIREQIVTALKARNRRADQLADTVRQAAARIFEVPQPQVVSDDTFEIVEQPYWVTEQWSASLSPLTLAATERMMPAAMRRRRLIQRLEQQVDGMVTRNVENLRWAIFQSIDQTFQRFSIALDERLAATIEATHGAVRAALAQREAHASDIAGTLAELSRGATAIAALREDLAAPVELAEAPSLGD